MEPNTTPITPPPPPTKPKRVPASPEKLAEIFRYLAAAFIVELVLNLVLLWLANSGSAPQLVPILQGVSFITAILLLIAFYIATRRLGFGKSLSILAVILVIFIPLFNLVLVISALVRIALHLRKSGWKITWSGAKPAHQ